MQRVTKANASKAREGQFASHGPGKEQVEGDGEVSKIVGFKTRTLEQGRARCLAATSFEKNSATTGARLICKTEFLASIAQPRAGYA
jgi:hypothetical protein